jgi:hypothetical protein
MSNSPQDRNFPPILGGIASIVGLLGIALYFTGWIYRWSYFGYFSLEVTTLDLPLQSFLLVPLQVFFGSFSSPIIIIKSIIAFLFILFLIYVTLLLLEVIGNTISKRFQDQLVEIPQTRGKKSSRIEQIWRSFAAFNLSKFKSMGFLHSLLNEAVIVFWVLVGLFWLACTQGLSDARRDTSHATSTRPVVAFVAPKSLLILGRDLETMLQEDKIAKDPPVADYRLLGDLKLFKKLREEDTNELTDERVWRLLIERGGWIYLFPTLPKNAGADERPPVLAIEKGGKSLIILAPNFPEAD